MSREYIQKHFTEIKQYENIIEQRLCDDFTLEDALSENARYMEKARQYHVPYVLIDEPYNIDQIVIRWLQIP